MYETADKAYVLILHWSDFRGYCELKTYMRIISYEPKLLVVIHYRVGCAGMTLFRIGGNEQNPGLLLPEFRYHRWNNLRRILSVICKNDMKNWFNSFTNTYLFQHRRIAFLNIEKLNGLPITFESWSLVSANEVVRGDT